MHMSLFLCIKYNKTTKKKINKEKKGVCNQEQQHDILCKLKEKHRLGKIRAPDGIWKRGEKRERKKNDMIW